MQTYNEPFLTFSDFDSNCFYSHFIRITYHSYAKDFSNKVGEKRFHFTIYLATFEVWESSLSVFPEGHRARNLACYHPIIDQLANIYRVTRINRADSTDQKMLGGKEEDLQKTPLKASLKTGPRSQWKYIRRVETQ